MAKSTFFKAPVVTKFLDENSIEIQKGLHVFLYGISARDNTVTRNIRDFESFKFAEGDKKFEKRVNIVNKSVGEAVIESIAENFEVKCTAKCNIVQETLNRLIQLTSQETKLQESTQQVNNKSVCSVGTKKSNVSLQASIELDLAKKELEIQEKVVALEEEIFSQEEKIIDLQAKIKKLEQTEAASATGELADLIQELETTSKLLRIKRSRVDSQKKLLEKQKEVAQFEANAKFEAIDEEERQSQIVDEQSVNNRSRVSRWLNSQARHINEQSHRAESNVESLPRSRSASRNEKRIDNLTENINRMLSRQTIGNNFGKFDGSSSLGWTIFLSQFNRTSEACGFTESEKVLRLDECLTGEARTKVEMLLLTATHPRDIIKILTTTYGKPEAIAEEIESRARKIPKIDSLKDFENFSCEVRNVTKALQNINCEAVNKRRLLSTLVSKLLPHLTTQWGSYLVENKLEAYQVTLNHFNNWSEDTASMLSKITFNKENSSENDTQIAENSRPERNADKSTFNLSENKNCVICQIGHHYVDHCPDFQKADIKQKWKMAEKAGVCYCCLKIHKGKCRKRIPCGVDGSTRFHNALLHKIAESKIHESNNSIVVKSSGSILKMISVKLRGPLGEVETVAFLDDGSTGSFIDADLAKKLGLTGPVVPLCFKWTGETYRYDPDSEKVSLSVSGLLSSDFISMENVRTVYKLDLTKQHWDISELKKNFSYLELADLRAVENGQPMILIGQMHAGLITSREIIQPLEDGPILSKTKLGWIVHGPTGHKKDYLPVESVFACCEISEKLHDEVKKYFSVENFGVALIKEKKSTSLNEEKAVQLAESSLKNIGKRYEVDLPWKNDDPLPHGSKEMALQRLKCLEKKLLRNNQTAKIYKDEIEKLIQKKYAVEVQPCELNGKKRVWFIPHFGVINVNKPGKIRPVFDSAAKVNGKSINDYILIGPDWLTSLFGIILKFRQFSIGFSADIREMFNRVKISDADSYAQCFLWRGLDNKQPVKIYRMTAMIFGMASSPFLAQFVKNSNAKRFQEDFPEAVKAIIENHYVDDFVFGTDTEEEAEKVIKDVIGIHEKGGFELRNFASNSQKVLSSIPRHLVGNGKLTSLDGNETEQRILGMNWDTETDRITFSMNFNKFDKALVESTRVPTKREVLKVVMSAYDPIGFLSPVIIKGRILLQEIWRAGIGWDDFITAQMCEKWKLFLIELKQTNEVQLSRCYSRKLKTTKMIQLHTLCDASEKAYAAVTYLRIQDDDGVESSIIASKARVAPLRSLTIPKLELMAAVLAARLSKTVMDSLDLQVQQRFFWSDSRTVLNWLSSERKLQTFVAARVGEILELSNIEEWKWIPTKENVADDCTRDTPVKNFNENHRWFAGPDFLTLEENEWPKTPTKEEILKTEECEITMSITVATEEPDSLPEIKTHYSWIKTLRITAWMKRFIDNAKAGRGSANWKSGPLRVAELDWSEKKWWIAVQKSHFFTEREDATSKRKIKMGRLKRVDLEMDEDGLLKISGRLSKIDKIDAHTKNPICLHRDHKYVKLMINYLHQKNGHQGLETVINELHKKFWIPNVRAVVKKIKSDCFYCKKKTCKPAQPKMGLLPTDRLRFDEKPFTATGMDYFGPFQVKIGRRLEKRYGVLFTCLTMRAVHLEVAHSLNTDSCIMALRRFLNRRGDVKIIWSDNGTNMRGANHELLLALEDLDEHQIMDEMTKKRIEWRFNPPAAPHMGGSWERMVGSVKRAIHAILREKHPTDEVLRTVFTEAEYIVNSRPLTRASLDKDDPVSISPNDILLCHSSNIGKPGNFSKNDEIVRKQWRVSQFLTDQFWIRWKKEYLPTLNYSTKWFKEESNLKENELVIVQDDNLARASWALGVIQNIYKGKDGIVRVADVKTAKGMLKRPVVKLHRLELCVDNMESTPGGSNVTEKQ